MTKGGGYKIYQNQAILCSRIDSLLGLLFSLDDARHQQILCLNLIILSGNYARCLELKMILSNLKY